MKSTWINFDYYFIYTSLKTMGYVESDDIFSEVLVQKQYEQLIRNLSWYSFSLPCCINWDCRGNGFEILKGEWEREV